jgi:hypothetical protein
MVQVARLSRLFHCFAVPVFITVFLSLASIWVATKGGVSAMPINANWVLVGGGCLGLLIVALQTFLNYKKSKYDVSLALQYSDIFFDEDFNPKRFAAASVVRAAMDWDVETRKGENLLNAEPVLDVLEDLGFFLKNGQISDEVVHHFFSHWIQIYIQPIEWWLLELREKRDTKYNHLLSLFDRMRMMEAMLGNYGFWSRFTLDDVNYPIAQLKKDLTDEIEDCSPPMPESFMRQFQT